MSSQLLSALEGAEQDPSQGYRGGYPDYSPKIQEVSSSGPSEDDVEIVNTSSYRLNISGNTSSAVPLSMIHKEPQNFNRGNCMRIPKKLTPPPNKQEIITIPQSPPSHAHQRHYIMQGLPQSPPSDAHQRQYLKQEGVHIPQSPSGDGHQRLYHKQERVILPKSPPSDGHLRLNGYAPLPNTNTPTSPSPQGSKYILMTQQGPVQQNMAHAHQHRTPQNSIPQNMVHQSVVSPNRSPQNFAHNRLGSPTRQTFEPYVPNAMQSSSKSAPQGTGSGNVTAFRGTGRGRGRGRGRGQSSKGRGRSLHGNATGLNMSQYGTSHITFKSDSPEGRQLQLLLNKHSNSNPRIPVVQQVSSQQNQVQQVQLPTNTHIQQPNYTIVYRTVVVNNGSNTPVTNIPVATQVVNNAGVRSVAGANVPMATQIVNNAGGARPVTYTEVPVGTRVVNSAGTSRVTHTNVPAATHRVNSVAASPVTHTNVPAATHRVTSVAASPVTHTNVPAATHRVNSVAANPVTHTNVPAATHRVKSVAASPVTHTDGSASTHLVNIINSIRPNPVTHTNIPGATRIVNSAGASQVSHTNVRMAPRIGHSSPISRPPSTVTTIAPATTRIELISDSDSNSPSRNNSFVSSPVSRPVPSESRRHSLTSATPVMSPDVTSSGGQLQMMISSIKPATSVIPATSYPVAPPQVRSIPVMSTFSTSTSAVTSSVAGRPFVTESQTAARPPSLMASPPAKKRSASKAPRKPSAAKSQSVKVPLISSVDAAELLLAVSKCSPLMKQQGSLPQSQSSQPSTQSTDQSVSQASTQSSQSSQEAVVEEKSSQEAVAEKSSQEAVAEKKPTEESVDEGKPSSSSQEADAEDKSNVGIVKVQQKEIPEKPPRPKTPEIPSEYADKEGLCPYCGAWSANLKTCESCKRALYFGKRKPVKYRNKKDGIEMVLYPPYEPSTSVKNAEGESPKVVIIKKTQSAGGVGTNQFYSKTFDAHFDVYNKNTSGIARMSTRGGGRGSRRGRGRGRGRQPAKRPEPELISISSDDDDEEDDSSTSGPSSRPVTPAATPNRNAMATSESNGSPLDSSSDAEVCRTPPVKRKAKMRDPDGNTPVTSAPITSTPEITLHHKKATKKSFMISDSPEEEVAQVSLGVIPVVESMDVCLIRFGSWSPSIINPVVFQSNCVMFNFNAEVDLCPQLRLEAKDITLCQYSLKKGMPTIFIYTTPKFASVVRERLKMSKSNGGPYFDPGSSEESEKRVIIRPMCDPDHTLTNRIIEAFDGMAACTNRLKSALFEELDKETVNQLLVASKPPEHTQTSISQTSTVKNTKTSSSLATCNADSIITVKAHHNKTIVTIDPKTFRVTGVERPSGATANIPAGSVAENKESNAEEGEVIMRRHLGPCVTLFIYPPPPSTGGITVTSDDLACLDEGEFLNDVIIDFYLKYLMAEKLSEADKKRTHIFSSFFYKRLMQREYGRNVQNPELTAIEKRHNRVRKWTRNVDLFEKDFIVIPINESAHWYVAIICYPGKVNTPEVQSRSSKYSEESEESQTPSPPNISSEAEAAPISSETAKDLDPPELANECDGAAGGLGDEPTSANVRRSDEEDEPMDVDEREEDSDGSQPMPMETQEPPSAIEDSSSKNSPSGTWNVQDTQCSSTSGGSQQESAQSSPSTSTANVDDAPLKFQQAKRQQPCILIFDSLRGPCRRHVIQKLREYLAMEWQTRKKSNCVFDGSTMRGQTPEVPQQSNYSDCGVFVLQYVETFFEKSINISLPMRGLSRMFSEETADGKRVEIQELIEELKEEWNKTEEDR